jgi:hypothetical protein
MMHKPGRPCPYCQGEVTFMANSAPIYNGRNFGPIHICHPCRAWVGCHPNTYNPLGRLADATLRKAKSNAHRAFDPLWQAIQVRDGISKGEARARAYRWLAQQLGIDPPACHIGMFDVELCRRVVSVCEPYKQKDVA